MSVKITRGGSWDLVCVNYDGWPNGLKFHKDGRAFIACYKQSLMVLDVASAEIETVLETMYSEGFKGLNDLHFTQSGDLYFTDQGQTGILDWPGRVFRYTADGHLHRVATNVPSPNGIHPQQYRKEGLCGGHPHPADLAPAADGRRQPDHDRRCHPAFRWTCRA